MRLVLPWKQLRLLFRQSSFSHIKKRRGFQAAAFFFTQAIRLLAHGLFEHAVNLLCIAVAASLGSGSSTSSLVSSALGTGSHLLGIAGSTTGGIS
jgi:hypothetical protein